MSICAIIAEYNPFHNGHKYQIQKAKELTGASNIVVIMSGNFVQRGVPAMYDKWQRTKTAIDNDVDVVFELPVIYSSASAEYFAYGAISILNKLNSIDYLCFGCEFDDISILNKISDTILDEPTEYKNLLDKELKKGISYPVARSNALKNTLKKEFDEKLIEQIMLDPNNILAIEYLKALKITSSKIKPIAVKRIGTSHSSLDIESNYASSTAIRQFLKDNSISKIQDVVPKETMKMIAQNLSMRNTSY